MLIGNDLSVAYNPYVRQDNPRPQGSDAPEGRSPAELEQNPLAARRQTLQQVDRGQADERPGGDPRERDTQDGSTRGQASLAFELDDGGRVRILGGDLSLEGTAEDPEQAQERADTLIRFFSAPGGRSQDQEAASLSGRLRVGIAGQDDPAASSDESGTAIIPRGASAPLPDRFASAQLLTRIEDMVGDGGNSVRRLDDRA
ncbi:MAG: hypothetical protein PHQ14_08880 [Chromatiales bacterium]|jgi:hypothetical protein|nr:hypothetical protein [Chromatiales bacterium]MDX9765923.1 hypothetical protein [Ectothiorhodospiraceae bacterium]